jgi:hypothetical protein
LNVYALYRSWVILSDSLAPQSGYYYWLGYHSSPLPFVIGDTAVGRYDCTFIGVVYAGDTTDGAYDGILVGAVNAGDGTHNGRVDSSNGHS